jgi:hypothetical protein
MATVECARCGLCCWSYTPSGGWEPEDGDALEPCENLADDLRTCVIYDRLKGTKYAGCAPPHEPRMAHALHPDCALRKDWTERGIVDEDGRLIEVGHG